MKVLTHYTSFINMLHIIEDFEVIFGNLKGANDLTEYNNYSEDNISCFAFCCCKNEYNSSMWLAYSGRKHGSAISFYFKEGCEYNQLFDDNDIISREIDYLDNYIELAENPENIGFIKSKIFETEEEYQARYCILSEEMKSLENKYNQANIRNIDQQLHKDRLNEIISVLETEGTNYNDPAVLRKLVDTIVVKDQHTLEFQLACGINIKEQI